LIDKTVGLQTLDQLGFEAQNLNLFRQLIHKPYGVVLLSSPNGTGKTTTLYAALHELRNPATNILTCEDPVEYDLAGVNQTQINEKIGLNYPQQVRAILGQDPDVLLIGELKDKETAELAMRAGLSGHLVLSTLPANDAASAIPRLLDMGVDPYLLSTALVGTVSQRLLRVLCEDCKVESTPGEEDRALLDHYLGAGSVSKVWEAKGCDKCFETGYRGRTAVHEVMPISEEIGKMIAERAPLESIREAARYYGYLPLAYDALRRVQQGVTSLDEAKRTLVFSTSERSDAPRTLDLAS
jgi:type IV pilus assembly protein PilB